jgi:hypothetical protein
MRIVVVRPDYKITGGFETVVDKLINGLRENPLCGRINSE